MNITELKKWAKSHNFTVKNKDGGYEIKHNETEVCDFAENAQKLAIIVFNKITDNKFVEHQRNFKIESLSEHLNG